MHARSTLQRPGSHHAPADAARPPVAAHVQVSHVGVQARSKEQVQVAAELGRVRGELERYVGLPADATAARAETEAKRGELVRLRQQLQEQLNDMQ